MIYYFIIEDLLNLYLQKNFHRLDFILHPQFIGRACRVNALGELISYMKSRGAWITTNDEIARYVLQQEGFQLPKR